MLHVFVAVVGVRLSQVAQTLRWLARFGLFSTSTNPAKAGDNHTQIRYTIAHSDALLAHVKQHPGSVVCMMLCRYYSCAVCLPTTHEHVHVAHCQSTPPTKSSVHVRANERLYVHTSACAFGVGGCTHAACLPCARCRTRIDDAYRYASELHALLVQ